MVQTIYLQSMSKEWDCVAYKGGHFERDLLKSLGTPAVNLEDHGCPRYKELMEIDQTSNVCLYLYLRETFSPARS